MFNFLYQSIKLTFFSALLGIKAFIGIPFNVYAKSTHPYSSTFVKHFDKNISQITVKNINGTINCKSTSKDQLTVEEEILGKTIEVTKICSKQEADKNKLEITAQAFAQHDQEVHFTILIPSQADLNLQTENGVIKVTCETSSLKATSLNGAINVQELTSDAYLKTNNGAISVETKEEKKTIDSFIAKTNNGSIKLSILNNGILKGTCSTNNGSVKISVGPQAEQAIDCQCDLGSIKGPNKSIHCLGQESETFTFGKKETKGILQASTNIGSIKVRPTS